MESSMAEKHEKKGIYHLKDALEKKKQYAIRRT